MMISKIEIKNFGKLKNFVLDLNYGLQLIYGPNEFGKSTIMEFIKLMFYSRMSGEKAGIKDKAIRQKYAPWDGSQMLGAIEFTHDGSVYRLQKEISADSPSKDIVLFQNKSTGQNIRLGKKEEAGERLFALDLKSFERSGYISEIGKITVAGGKETNDSLADKIISNLASTGEADVSQSLITKRLDHAIRDLEWTKGNGGKIAQIKNDIYSLKQKIQDELKLQQEQEHYKIELAKIAEMRNEKKILESQLNQLSTRKKLLKIENIFSDMSELEEYKNNIQSKGLTYKEFSAFLQRLENLEKTINIKSMQLKESQTICETFLTSKKKNFEKEKSKKITVIIAGIVILILLILMFITKTGLILWYGTPILAAYFGYFVISNFKSKKESGNTGLIYRQHKEYLKEIEILKQNFISEIQKLSHVNEYNQAFEVFNDLVNEFSNMNYLEVHIISNLDAFELQNCSLKNLKLLIQKLKSEINYESAEHDLKNNEMLNFRLRELEIMNLNEKYFNLQSKIRKPTVSLDALYKDLKFQKSNLENMKKHLSSLKLAKLTLEESSDEIRKNFNPELDLKTSHIFEQLTGGKYKKVHVQKNYQMFISNESVDRLCDNLSSGTIDQAYLALRIAIAELISKENILPLILDDILMQYDNERLDFALKFLKNYPIDSKRQTQIILFTCHKHIIENALKNGTTALQF